MGKERSHVPGEEGHFSLYSLSDIGPVRSCAAFLCLTDLLNFHCGRTVDSGFDCHVSVDSSRYLPTFRNNLLPLTSGCRWMMKPIPSIVTTVPSYQNANLTRFTTSL